jgi:hypothetical protein
MQSDEPKLKFAFFLSVICLGLEGIALVVFFGLLMFHLLLQN